MTISKKTRAKLEKEILEIMSVNNEITSSSICKIILNSKKKFNSVSINPSRIADILTVLKKNNIVTYRIFSVKGTHLGMWKLKNEY